MEKSYPATMILTIYIFCIMFINIESCQMLVLRARVECTSHQILGRVKVKITKKGQYMDLLHWCGEFPNPEGGDYQAFKQW